MVNNRGSRSVRMISLARASVTAVALSLLLSTLLSCQLVNTILGRVGTISGRAYAGTIDSPPNYDVGRAILSISPTLAGSKYVVTDKSGSFTLSDVPAGDYQLTPIDLVNPVPTKVTVKPDQTTTVTVAFTSGVVRMYAMNNTLSSPPLNNQAVRTALIQAIDRESIVSNVPVTGYFAAVNFIPPLLNSGGWADNADKIGYSQSDANTALNAAVGSSFSLTLLVNDNGGSNNEGTNVPVANAIASDLQLLDRVSNATVDVESWDYLLNTGYADGNFQLVRLGWAIDTNNLVDMFDFLYNSVNPGKYTSSKVQPLIDQGNAALDKGDIPGYHEAVIALNNLWLQEGAFIPVDYQ